MARIPKPSGRKNRPTKIISYGRHLVYAEGSKTEPLYVKNIYENIKSNYKFKNTEIIIENVPHAGFSTLGLVQFAELDIEKRLLAKEKIDHVWIFYDKDSFPKDNFDNTFIKIESKNESRHLNDDGDNVDSNNICWHAIWSNECFELWVILHFENLRSSIPRDEYIKKINKSHLINHNYEKNMNDLYDILNELGNVEQAIRFAKKLHEDNYLGSPSTGVYKFLEYFKYYLNNYIQK